MKEAFYHKDNLGLGQRCLRLYIGCTLLHGYDKDLDRIVIATDWASNGSIRVFVIWAELNYYGFGLIVC